MQPIVFLWSAIAVLVLVVSIWAVSVRIKDASIVDIFWGFGFVVVGWVARLASGGEWNTRHKLLLAAATIWGLRLAGYLAWRNLGHGEDFRYRMMRKKHGDKFWLVSLRTVYLTQGLLMFFVSIPLQLGQMRFSGDRTGKTLSALLVVGFVVWLVGVLFETVGDIQLARFKANEANKGKVMDRGLWAWTRHPNYFGDSVAWWGMFIISLAARSPWLLIGVVGPIAMTILLRKVSGVPMLEHSMAKRRPGYTEYVARTSPFIPRPPKRSNL